MSAETAIIRNVANSGVCDDLQARVVANAWHGGQASASYAFVSTGAIERDRLLRELRNLTEDIRELHQIDSLALHALCAYVEAKGDRGPQPGWSELTW